MITIYAEKPDVGNKIAAALDKITLSSGKAVTFETLKANEKAVKAQQFKDGYLKITYKGQETYVTWGYGHLCELKQAVDYDETYKNWSNLPMPFIPPKYQVKVKDEVKKQFNLVSGLFKKSSLVINATDDDREGELIFYYLKTAANYKGDFKRVHMSSQTKEGFLDAFSKLKSAEDARPMTEAGRGRSIADWVIGSNLTVAMSLKYKNNNVLSVGRVQTPTLNMLVEKELAIRKFKPEPYFTISAKFTTVKKDEYSAEHKDKKFTDKKDAERIFKLINGKNGVVDSIEKKESYKEAPLLYNLSALQMAANAKHGFTLAKTLQVAQSLYEGGYTTYPRTDSQYLTEDMEPVINKVLNSLEKNSEYKPLISGHSRSINKKHYFDDSKVTSHYAIIPTVSDASSLAGDQKKLYDLIARSVIMMIYDKAKIEKTSVITDVVGEKFVSSGNVILEEGWMAVDGKGKEQILPKLSKGEAVSGKYELLEKITEPPKRYTDKTLVAAMISAGKELDDDDLKKVMASGVKGIGTEATRAAIIEALINRGYAERDKKSIYATDKGISLIQTLPLKEIKSAELTAMWEERLNKIAEKKDNFDSFVKDIEDLTRKWCREINESMQESAFNSSSSKYTCPICGQPVKKQAWGYGCTGYKEGCKFSISNTIAGKKLTDSQIDALFTKGNTGVIKGFTSKAGKKFDAKLKMENVYEKEKLMSSKVVFDFGAPISKSSSDNASESEVTHGNAGAVVCKCPICGANVVDDKWSWHCEKLCGFSVNHLIAGRQMTITDVKNLASKNKTSLLKGFTSKAGKKFDAYLVLEGGKTSFEFPPKTKS